MVKTNRSTLHMLYNIQQSATQDSDYIHMAAAAETKVTISVVMAVVVLLRYRPVVMHAVNILTPATLL